MNDVNKFQLFFEERKALNNPTYAKEFQKYM